MRFLIVSLALLSVADQTAWARAMSRERAAQLAWEGDRAKCRFQRGGSVADTFVDCRRHTYSKQQNSGYLLGGTKVDGVEVRFFDDKQKRVVTYTVQMSDVNEVSDLARSVGSLSSSRFPELGQVVEDALRDKGFSPAPTPNSVARLSLTGVFLNPDTPLYKKPMNNGCGEVGALDAVMSLLGRCDKISDEELRAHEAGTVGSQLRTQRQTVSRPQGYPDAKNDTGGAGRSSSCQPRQAKSCTFQRPLVMVPSQSDVTENCAQPNVTDRCAGLANCAICNGSGRFVWVENMPVLCRIRGPRNSHQVCAGISALDCYRDDQFKGAPHYSIRDSAASGGGVSPAALTRSAN